MQTAKRRYDRLTQTQQNMLFAIYEFKATKGINPKIEDLMNELGLSKCAVYETIKRLQRDGWLVHTAYKTAGKIGFARSIKSNGLQIPIIGECW